MILKIGFYISLKTKNTKHHLKKFEICKKHSGPHLLCFFSKANSKLDLIGSWQLGRQEVGRENLNNMAGCPVRGKEQLVGDFPWQGLWRTEMFSFKIQIFVSMMYFFSLSQHFTKSSVIPIALCQWNCGKVSDLKKTGSDALLSSDIWDWRWYTTGKRKVTLGTSQSSGEGPKNQGRLAREQANSELDMSQTLFVLNILEKGNSQDSNSSSLFSSYMILDKLYNLQSLLANI